MHIKLWAAAGLAAALVGCHDRAADSAEGGGSEESGAPSELEIHDFFIAAETSYCGWAARCGAYETADDCLAVEFFDVTYPDGLLASAVFRQQFGGAVVKYLLQSFEAGRIEFDAEAAATCLAYVDARGCDRPWTYTPSEEEVAGRKACASVFRGTMTRNGPCIVSMECARGEFDEAVCGFDPTCTDACCAGGCRVLVAGAEGEACNNTTGCQPGLFCAVDPNTFQPTVCTKKLPVGAQCFNGDDCADGTFCWGGTCRRGVELGGSCLDAPCEPNSYCADLNDSGNYTCIGFGDVGDPCIWDDGCRHIAATCDYEARECVTLPKVGESCIDGVGACAPTAFCDWNAGVCVTKAAEGEACGWIGDDFDGKFVACAGSLLCDESSTARCEAPVAGNTCAVPELTPLPGEG